ncbi:hypothetical protein [Selenomonas felix]|uniref:hypothetical protein n=1 Tax=Selenomonas felix TaxID=1944634 RepID=UPI000C8284A2|nr:hypothetical protein [Selenomonas felix]
MHLSAHRRAAPAASAAAPDPASAEHRRCNWRHNAKHRWCYGWNDAKHRRTYRWFDTEHRYIHGRYGDNPGRLDGLDTECRNDHRRVNPQHGNNNRWHHDGHSRLVYFEYNNRWRHDRLNHGYGRHVDHNRRFFLQFGWFVYNWWIFLQLGRLVHKRRFILQLGWIFFRHGHVDQRRLYAGHGHSPGLYTDTGRQHGRL